MRSRRTLAWIAPGLLVLVASLQIWRVSALDQSSWSGGGFGMFATIDSESFRLVRGFTTEDGIRHAIPIPNELEREAFELQVVPSEDRAVRLVDRWAKLRDDGQPLTLEVWRLRFDPVGPQLHVELLRGARSS